MHNNLTIIKVFCYVGFHFWSTSGYLKVLKHENVVQRLNDFENVLYYLKKNCGILINLE